MTDCFTSWFRCPGCKGALSVSRTLMPEWKQEDDLFCPACMVTYPVIGGIPVFLDLTSTGWISLGSATLLWEKSGRPLRFPEFLDQLQQLSSPTLDYESAVKKAAAMQSEEYLDQTAGAGKKIDRDDDLWERHFRPLHRYVGEKTAAVVAAGTFVLDVASGDAGMDGSDDESTTFGVDLELRFSESGMMRKVRQPGRSRYCHVCADIRTPPFKNGFFDIATSRCGLSHVYRCEQALNAVSRVIKPGGILIMTDFNEGAVYGALPTGDISNVMAEVGMAPGFRWIVEKFTARGFRLIELELDIAASAGGLPAASGAVLEAPKSSFPDAANTTRLPKRKKVPS